MQTIIIENKIIYDYFEHNKHISAESALLTMIDIMELATKNAQEMVNNMVHTKILSHLGEQNLQLRELKAEMSAIKSDVILKMLDIKKDYIEDIKSVIGNQGILTLDKITGIVEKTNSVYLDKTTLLLNDIIPKTHDTYNKQIEQKIRGFQKALIDETEKLLATKPTDISLGEFLSNFESKTAFLLQSGVNQPLHNIITATEERLNNTLNFMRENTTNKEIIFENLNDFLNKNKYKNSNAKGKFSENKLEEVLNQMFASCYIKNTSSIPESGDFILQKRENGKPDILFENKDYSVNLNGDEVDKFIRDIKVQGCHGILISQNSGIVNKKPYQIELYNHQIVVFILNCGYDPDKIKIAVDIIDTLSSCLGSLFSENTTDTAVSNLLLNEINMEYMKFSQQKLAIIENIKTTTKDMAKRLLAQIDDIHFPALSSFLSGKMGNYSGGVAATTASASGYNNDVATLSANSMAIVASHVCNLCNVFVGKNAVSLAAHKKGCSKKYKN